MRTTTLNRIPFFAILMALLLFVIPQKSQAHCEIPCGIYGDSVRIVLIKEHITTIRKSMKQIQNLSAETPVNYNQLVRWVMNKEEHAKKIQDIATQYFMFQRVKLTDDPKMAEKNAKLLKYLHEICVYAMKAKQTTDEGNCDKILQALDHFEKLYFGEKKGPHKH